MMSEFMQAAITKYHGLDGWLMNNRNVFLTVLEARKSKVKVSADLVSGKGCSSVHGDFSCYDFTWQKGLDSSLNGWC